MKIQIEPPVGVELKQKAQEALAHLIQSVPDVNFEVQDAPRAAEWDFSGLVQTPSNTHLLLCKVKSRALPNELYSIAAMLQRAVRAHDQVYVVPVLIAPYFSPQSISLCRELGLSWADLSGNGELKLPESYIRVNGLWNPYRKGHLTASLYSLKSSRVIHALLLQPNKEWTVASLAEVAGVSLGQAAAVRKHLEINGWLTAKYSSAILTKPEKLLNDWAIHYRPKRNVIRFFSLDTPLLLESRAAALLQTYALGEFSASEQYSPYVRHQRSAIYVEKWPNDSAKQLDLRYGDGTYNVTIYESHEALRYKESINGAWCTSPILTYLDLFQLPSRGADAAQHLLESVILKRWKNEK